MKIAEIFIAVLLAMAIPALADDASSAPKDSAPPVAATTSGQPATSADEMTPDTNPLSGALQFTLGTLANQRSEFNANLFVSESLATNQLTLGGSGGLGASANLAGTVNLQRLGSRSTTNLSYTAGGWLSETFGYSSNYQQLSLTQGFEFRRWSLTFSDLMTYTPTTYFGFPGAGLTNGNLNNTLVPEQSIIFGAPLMSNTVVGQVNYDLTGRSSLTAVASLGFLDVLNLGTDSRAETFNFGYNYALTGSDSVAAMYGISLTQYPGQTASFTTHTLNAAYGRRVTGRMALRAAGGAQILTFGSPAPAAGSGAVGATNTSIPAWTTWNANAGMTYQLDNQTILSLGFSHGVNSGSGVLLGANGNSVQAGVIRQLGRKLVGNLQGAYAHNAALQQFIGTNVPLGASFNSEFVALGLQYPLNPHMALTFNYHLQHQNSNFALCLASCSNTLLQDSLLQHFFMFGFHWSLKSAEFDKY